MSIASRLRYWNLIWFSKPRAHRPLYRSIYKRNVRSILEIGLQSPLRTERMIRLASMTAGLPVYYAVIDPFEMGEAPQAGRKLSLKEAHQFLRRTGARVRLLPGDPDAVLARSANSLGKFDLVLIANPPTEALGRGWHYMPRLLHGGSPVWVGAGVNQPYRQLSPAEIEALARSHTIRPIAKSAAKRAA